MIGVFRKIAKSFKYSFEGIVMCLQRERNFRIHVFAALLIAYISPLYHFSTNEIVKLAIIVFLVLILEMVNTSIENLVNLVTKEYNETARIVKDLSAGAVGMAALCAMITGYFLLVKDVNFAQTFAPIINPFGLITLGIFLTLGIIFISLPIKK